MRDGDVLDGLGTEFCRAIRALGEAGEAEFAHELAARAWWVVRDSAPRVAAHINGVMHQLTTIPSTTVAGDDIDTPPVAILDVRDDPPAKRHERIFATFEALDRGTQFELVNDHDPKPLAYQFAAEHPETHTWTAVEAGPEVWRVRIGRP
ncbi:MAG: DUF2249 domain-containing protein [Nitriliruptoraceae bacterium]